MEAIVNEQIRIKSAICKIECTQRGTGWFCSSDGYILTAGHIITNDLHKIINQNENVIVQIF